MNNKDETYLSFKPFRPVLTIDNIATYPEHLKDPNYIYGSVVTNYKGALANNFAQKEAEGWEVVYSTHTYQDDRLFAPDNNKEISKVPQAVIKRATDGHEYVLMRIHKDRYDANEKARHDKEVQAYLRSIGKNAKTMNLNANGSIRDIEIEDTPTVFGKTQSNSGDEQ